MATTRRNATVPGDTTICEGDVPVSFTEGTPAAGHQRLTLLGRSVRIVNRNNRRLLSSFRGGSYVFGKKSGLSA